MKLLSISVALLVLIGPMGTRAKQLPPPLSLDLRIVPTSFTEQGQRTLSLIPASQHFDVVVTNTGKELVRVWQDTCSQGYANLSFEAQFPDGTKSVIMKKPRGWEKNFPQWIALPPGDHFVMEVTFDEATWKNSPLVATKGSRTLQLRAILESPETSEAKKLGVWTGKIVSRIESYTILSLGRDLIPYESAP